MPLLRPEERIGSTLAERYRLDRILGKGGMGVVFAGAHVLTGRPVAVKLILPHYAEEPSILQRFFQEARAAAALGHPHVVDVLDMGQDTEGDAFIVLEYLDGEPMSAQLKRERRLALRTLLEIVLPVMDALSVAHARGILHRDLKPDNLFVATGLRGRKVPKLLDFGVAKLLETPEGSGTVTGSLLGTPNYMSPEQARGDRDLDARADVWSMGVVCYEALAGRLPFRAETSAMLLFSILSKAPPPLREVAPDVHPAVAAVIDRALSPDRDGRFASMREMIAALIDAARPAGVSLDATLLELGSEDAARSIAASPSDVPKINPTVALPPGSLPSTPTRDGPVGSDAIPPTMVITPTRSSAPRTPAAGRPPMGVWIGAGALVTVALLGGAGVTVWALSDADGGTEPESAAPTEALEEPSEEVEPVVEELSSIFFTNRSSRPIADLYLRPSGEEDWGDDHLVGDLAPGDSHTVTDVECGQYDLLLVDPDATECVMLEETICDGPVDWDLTEEAIVACQQAGAAPEE